MSKPIFHAISSAKRYGGTPEDYIEIHNFMDSSKGAVPDNRHRALTHNSWFLSNVLERVFGYSMTNSSGRVVSVREIGEQHILEDFGNRFIPTAQDFIQEMEIKPWMNNGSRGTVPPSHSKVEAQKKITRIDFD
jgi:hypothetical protein